MQKDRISDTSISLLDSVLNAQDAEVIIADGKCRIVYANKEACRRMGVNKAFDLSCKNKYAVHFTDACLNCPVLKKQKTKENKFDLSTAEGYEYEASASEIKWPDGSNKTIIYVNNVDKKRKLERRLEYLAFMDPLTDVPNRRRFREDFERLSDDILSGKARGVVAIFDLDNFKKLNDTYGHHAGDDMLHMLAKYLMGIPEFKGHLYRMGGDEFLVFLADDASEEKSAEFYGDILKKTLNSYTLPNIELECTVSIGAAFFPQHGTSASELMRRADIAMYKAKLRGRNQLVFFENSYDSAGKFIDTYVTIQPILDANNNTFGYEFAEKSNDQNLKNTCNTTLKNYDKTVHALGGYELIGNSKYFISMSRGLLSSVVIKNFPKDNFIIKIKGAGDTDLIERYRELKAAEYNICVNNPDLDNINREILQLGDFVQIDYNKYSEIRHKAVLRAYPGKRFIAAGIENNAQFLSAKNAGYVLFKGYYFSEPVIRAEKDMQPLRSNYLRLMHLCHKDEYMDLSEISAIISSDVVLSYKLLKMLNSASFGRRHKISSIDLAVAYIGQEPLKKWVSLLALCGAADNKPLEIIRMSLVRAQFAELLSVHFSPQRNTKQMFLTGLLSLLDVAMDRSFDDIFKEINVSEEISDSIRTQHGPYSDVCELFRNYEYGIWDEISKFSINSGIPGDVINECYFAAVQWYNKIKGDI